MLENKSARVLFLLICFRSSLFFLTTVKFRISSMTLGQKDWRLCWASLLLVPPNPPSVDIFTKASTPSSSEESSRPRAAAPSGNAEARARRRGGGSVRHEKPERVWSGGANKMAAAPFVPSPLPLPPLRP